MFPEEVAMDRSLEPEDENDKPTREELIEMGVLTDDED
ncbi:hypothetical protein Nizo1840_2343 [Lactiplantibacillus plantarum]|nr:hypothetical protein Nizo1840_2343 [Lactiplantibacillus plantarum]